jgi:hypothetical protein
LTHFSHDSKRAAQDNDDDDDGGGEVEEPDDDDGDDEAKFEAAAPAGPVPVNPAPTPPLSPRAVVAAGEEGWKASTRAMPGRRAQSEGVKKGVTWKGDIDEVAGSGMGLEAAFATVSRTASKAFHESVKKRSSQEESKRGRAKSQVK